MRILHHLDFRGCSGRVRRYRSLSKQLRGWLATGLVPGHSVALPGSPFLLTILNFPPTFGYSVVWMKSWAGICVANAVAFVAYDPSKLLFFIDRCW